MIARPRDLSGISVLVTDGHYKHTVGIVRHLGVRNATVDLVSFSPKDIACTSRYCRSTVLSDDAESPSFLEAIREAVTKQRYDALIPVSYKATRALAQNRALFEPHVGMALAEASKVEMAANKHCMAVLAEKIGVPAPKTLAPASLAEVREFLRNLEFPVVVKPQKETSGYSVTYVRDEKALLELYEKFFCAEPASPQDIPLMQEYIPGRGCGFFATYQNGACKRVFMHRRVREYPASGGVSTCAESFHDPKLAECGQRLLDTLGWHGVAMVEFRHDIRDGQFKLMEVNPKFWGSLELALAAGADFPGDLCCMATGQDLAFTDSYQRDLRFHWPLSVSGELYHLWSRPQSLLNVTFDCLNPRVASNIWLRDFGPHSLELRHLCRLMLGNRYNRQRLAAQRAVRIVST